ncbi:MAG: YjfB family protein [Candidatus Competibacteraceae bacterium]|nr:YjfB family protein [Candidatus Competibacteraceae bacterium]
MESLSVASIMAWHQQNLDMQVGISVLKKSMDVQAESALFLLESVVAPVAAVSTPALVIDGSLGQNIDVRV